MKELYLCGDKDLKITIHDCSGITDDSALIGISFHCERLVTVTELMQLEDWIHKIIEKECKK